MISSELLKLLTCPVTNKHLKYDKENNELISEEAGLAYPIIEGDVPILLPDQARRIPKKVPEPDQEGDEKSSDKIQNVA